MAIDINLLQNFLLSTVLVFAFVVLGVGIYKLFKKHPIKTQEPDLASGYRKIIRTANRHAKNVLIQTTIEASNILSGTKRTNEKLEENLDAVLQSIAKRNITSLKETSGNFDKEYNAKLENIQEQVDQHVQKMLADTQKAYDDKLEQFQSNLLKNGLSTQEIVDKKTAELINTADSEIAEYKKAQFEKIESEANKLIEKVYKDVLRISLPESVHKDLIIKSLEEAKKEELFKL